MQNRAYLTAIARTSASAPLQWLLNDLWVISSVLDYGCGKGMDVEHLNNMGFEAYGYDPHYRPNGIPLIQSNTVLCTYVLNVIEDKATRDDIVARLIGYTKPGGYVFITVRNDKDKLNGTTSRGTWQGFIDCPDGWKVHTSNSSFIIYSYQKPL